MLRTGAKIMLSVFAAAPALLATAATVATAAAEPTLTVAWRIKPPYHYIENGIEKGFLLERAKLIFATAEIPARFVEMPSKRIWANFEHGTKSYCSIGWYQLPSRERIVQYSKVFHVDQPQTLLIAPVAVQRVRSHKTLDSLLHDPSLSLGVVDGVSYGPQIDNLIAHSGNQVTRKTVEPSTMARMVAANRISFMFIDRDDWTYLTAHEDSLRRIAQHDFSDMPVGLKRYIVCSKDVPAAVMVRLNKAIDSVKSNGETDGSAPLRDASKLLPIRSKPMP